MAKKPMFSTRDQALDYLAERHLLTKNRNEYTTAYAKRLATTAKKAEQRGEEFNRTAARGHAAPKIEHLAPGRMIGPLEKGQKRGPEHAQPQHILHQPKTLADIQRLAKRGGYPRRETYSFLIYGYSDQSGSDKKYDPNKPHHYTAHINREGLTAQFTQDSPKTPVLIWANEVSPYGWTDIISISLLAER